MPPCWQGVSVLGCFEELAMELIVVSGFLGSGKTTVLLALAKHFGALGRKVAVIENEVGKDGIDGELLQAEGLAVREIYSGCICCSLRHDLIQTLLELEREYEPDLVFLEPSGVAAPKQIQHALNGYGGEIDGKTMIVVADAKRLPAIQDFSMPLIHDGLEIADLVVVNKVDLVTTTELGKLQERIAEANGDVRQFAISANQGVGMTSLIEAIESRCQSQVAEKPHPAHPGESGLPEAAIFATTLELESPDPNVVPLVMRALESLSVALDPADGILIGHIKAIIRAQPVGYAVFSVTDHGAKAAQKGRLPDTLKRCKVILNAIVYGIEPDVFEVLCQQHVDALLHELKGLT
jgi:G3E family GTPase